MAIELQVALVALAGTILGVLVTLFTSVGIGIANTVRRANERFWNGRRLHEKYSDPLAASARDLMRRLDELVRVGGRDYYLQTRSRRTEFELHKANSTLYRVAAMLAWIRALRRELFFLRADRGRPREHQRALESALDRLAAALADGQHMEVLRVAKAAEQLGLELQDDALEEVGQKLDFELDRFVHSRGRRRIRELPRRGQRRAVAIAVSAISGRDARDRSLEYRWEDLVPALDAREAWIYRDWQSAIGDLMLIDAPEGPRKYDVVGYREFERLLESGNEEQRKWLDRLGRLFEDLDMSKSPSEDARIGSVRAMYRACGEIILAVDKLDGRRSPVDDALKNAATSATQLN
ncbi:hypothetical protein [uncultured Microbacterium sp.]|uniref:hypothetical protein n=1 Tax=uncultured Microbacterium sp. TaxID=191216 RepID=UPI002621011B|nr:hypothetical protein [uncultured Microbacterium sp.]